jgi:hypothetical protein
MDRKEYLKELFTRIETQFGLDLSRNKKGIKFASEAIRKKMTVQETLEHLEKEYCLIRLENE